MYTHDILSCMFTCYLHSRYTCTCMNRKHFPRHTTIITKYLGCFHSPRCHQPQHVQCRMPCWKVRGISTITILTTITVHNTPTVVRSQMNWLGRTGLQTDCCSTCVHTTWTVHWRSLAGWAESSRQSKAKQRANSCYNSWIWHTLYNVLSSPESVLGKCDTLLGAYLRHICCLYSDLWNSATFHMHVIGIITPPPSLSPSPTGSQYAMNWAFTNYRAKQHEGNKSLNQSLITHQSNNSS